MKIETRRKGKYRLGVLTLKKSEAENYALTDKIFTFLETFFVNTSEFRRAKQTLAYPSIEVGLGVIDLEDGDAFVDVDYKNHEIWVAQAHGRIHKADMSETRCKVYNEAGTENIFKLFKLLTEMYLPLRRIRVKSLSEGVFDSQAPLFGAIPNSYAVIAETENEKKTGVQRIVYVRDIDNYRERIMLESDKEGNRTVVDTSIGWNYANFNISEDGFFLSFGDSDVGTTFDA